MHNNLVEAKRRIFSDSPVLIRLSRTLDAAFALSRRDLQVNIYIYAQYVPVAVVVVVVPVAMLSCGATHFN